MTEKAKIVANEVETAAMDILELNNVIELLQMVDPGGNVTTDNLVAEYKTALELIKEKIESGTDKLLEAVKLLKTKSMEEKANETTD